MMEYDLYGSHHKITIKSILTDIYNILHWVCYDMLNKAKKSQYDLDSIQKLLEIVKMLREIEREIEPKSN